MASAGWTGPFVRWHDGLGSGPGRCPLLAVCRSASSIVVDRIALAGSWPEWRARSLAQGWRSALGVAIDLGPGRRPGALIVYSRIVGTATRELQVAERAARLASRIIAGGPTVKGP
jgi:hypothetical protein